MAGETPKTVTLDDIETRFKLAFRELHQIAELDSNNENAINFDNFISFARENLSQTEFDTILESGRLREIFEKIDRSHDGHISVIEYHKWKDGFKTPKIKQTSFFQFNEKEDYGKTIQNAKIKLKNIETHTRDNSSNQGGISVTTTTTTTSDEDDNSDETYANVIANIKKNKLRKSQKKKEKKDKNENAMPTPTTTATTKEKEKENATKNETEKEIAGMDNTNEAPPTTGIATISTDNEMTEEIHNGNDNVQGWLDEIGNDEMSSTKVNEYESRKDESSYNNNQTLNENESNNKTNHVIAGDTTSNMLKNTTIDTSRNDSNADDTIKTIDNNDTNGMNTEIKEAPKANTNTNTIVIPARPSTPIIAANAATSVIETESANAHATQHTNNDNNNNNNSNNNDNNEEKHQLSQTWSKESHTNLLNNLTNNNDEKESNNGNEISKDDRKRDDYQSYSHITTELDTEIFLIRHGRTEWNIAHKYQGQDDSDLVQEGIDGAMIVGQKLAMLHNEIRPFNHCYVSTLGRAQHTAKIILKQFEKYPNFDNNNNSNNNNNDDNSNKSNKNKDNLLDLEYYNNNNTSKSIPFKIDLDERIMERHFGDIQGRSHKEIALLYPNEAKLLGNGNEPFDWKPPQCKKTGKTESIRDLGNRCVSFLNEITNKHRGQRIMVISHGGAIDGMMRYILDRHGKPRVYYVRNCAINVVLKEKKSGKWFVSLLGDDSFGHTYHWINTKKENNNNTNAERVNIIGDEIDSSNNDNGDNNGQTKAQNGVLSNIPTWAIIGGSMMTGLCLQKYVFGKKNRFVQKVLAMKK